MRDEGDLEATLLETLSHFIARHKDHADAIALTLAASHPNMKHFLNHVEELLKKEEILVREGSAMKNRMENLRREEQDRSGCDPFKRPVFYNLLERQKEEIARLTSLREALMKRLEEFLTGSQREKAVIDRARALLQSYSQRPSNPPAQFVDRKS